jgi:Ribbon-helix-helix protein, copG family
MTIFYPPSDDEPAPITHSMRQAVLNSMMSIQQSVKATEALQRESAASRHRVATFRIPVEQLQRLDEITADAATSRSHLLRQIVAEYICYVDECSIRYRGSLLTAHSSKRKR